MKNDYLHINLNQKQVYIEPAFNLIDFLEKDIITVSGPLACIDDMPLTSVPTDED